MGNSQSNYVSKSVPIVTKPITLIKNSADKDGADIMWQVADVLADHDMGERLAQSHVVGRDCFGIPKEFSLISPNHSGTHVLLSYKEVRNVNPIQLEPGECFKPGTSGLIDNVLFSNLYDPPKPCCVLDKKAMAAIALCCAMPYCCPLIALCWLCGDCSSTPSIPTVSKIERAKSLMATLKALEQYIDAAPRSKGCCCFQRTMGLDKPTLKLYLGFHILNEIDAILAEMMSTMSNISAVYDVLMPLLDEKARDELLKTREKVRRKEEENKKKDPVPAADEYANIKNTEYKEFLIGKRVCRDFISNDLLDMLFHNTEKTPVGGSVNFISMKVMPNDIAEVSEKIKINFESLLPSAEMFLPTAILPIVKILTDALEVMCMTIRVKEASHVMEKNKNEAERLKGTQDLLGLRLFIGNKRVFLSFAAATLAAYKIKQLPNVANVVVSHKLKFTTAFLDFKVVVELEGPNRPFFEIQIVPSENFIVDEAVKGHAQYK